ncbi:MAG: aldo/keto reductase [Planctomycetota bacterium]|jgi:aryl-alcohol dehydrogenase-like predicted oxidoreductase
MNSKRRLGQTDLEISPIGLGTLQFAGGLGFLRFMYQKLSPETMSGIVKAALDGGVNWFDTAEIYGNGSSERSLASALKTAGKTNSDVVIATKWYPLFRTAGNIGKTIDIRLKCLGGYNIDLYQVHFSNSFSSTRDVMNRMADLVEKGKVRSVGVSNYSVEKMRHAHDVLAERGLPLASNQVHYSLLNRKIESNGILAIAKKLGITIIAYSPLESGLLSGKFHDDSTAFSKMPFYRRVRLKSQLKKSRQLIDALKEIAITHSATPAQVALNWLINFHSEAVVAIPGASSVKQARENAEAMRFTLSPQELTQIDKLSRKYLD